MKNLKISTRLFVGFATMGALIVLLGIAMHFKAQDLGRQFTLFSKDLYPKVAAVNQIAAGIANNARAARDLVMLDSPAARAPVLAEVAKTTQTVTQIYQTLDQTVTSPTGRDMLARLLAARAAYAVPRDKLLSLVQAGDKAAAAQVLMEELQPAQITYQARLAEFTAFEEKLMDQADTEVEQGIASTENLVLGLVGGSLVFACAMGLWITRSTVRPLAQAVDIARSVAAGDLTREFDTQGHNETAQLLQALHDMQTQLAGIVGEVRQNADGVVTASAEIAQGNNDLSSRTEQQASALEETAAAMEELSGNVKHNADNARLANQLAANAANIAKQGGEVVGEVVDTMQVINDSSRKIADIISVIDGIAFQTNILALNAAVEAARAGEQGRGFAVVASEVRNLAQRSAGAAKEIKDLIDNSVRQVDQGSALVLRAGGTMAEIVSAINRVSHIMGEVSAASSQQSDGVAQVGDAISQMDQVTQQNAALVEEAAAASNSLSQQAQQLLQTVAAFKTQPGKAPAALVATPVKTSTNSLERRGPERARNVVRPAFGKTAAVAAPARVALPSEATGSDDWTSF